jgi:tripartite-type tricarboxylate transporter receptor subunit TctC
MLDKSCRRAPARWANLALGMFLACSVAWQAASAALFPVKPVRLVTVSAGSQADAVSRVIGNKLAEMWRQPVVIENRPGAGGALGASIVAKAAPDGHTLLLQSAQFAVGAALHSKLPYDAVKDFAGITFLGSSALVLIASKSSGVKTVAELVAYAKAQPKPILFSSAGAGSSSHMNGERFKLASGIAATHVGFKGSADAAIEVAAGRVHYAVVALSVALPMISSAQATPLAVIAPRRSPTLPNVPLMTETYSGYGRDGAFCLVAPAGTPLALRRRIADDVKRVVALPDAAERLQRLDFNPVITGPEDFERQLRSDIETFRRIGRLAGLIAK